jgi:ComF family protein
LCVCPRCQEKFSTIFAKSKLQDVKVLAIYEYNEFMQTNLYKLKGCADLEMSAAFLSYHQLFLRLKYRNYTLIPAPSFSENDVQRGFNHVEEIFKGVGKETLKAIIKISNRKQSDLSAVERSKVGEVLCWNDDVNITNKKILLVDDVMTTGSTIQACLSLIKKHNPKSIEVVVMSKVKNKGER